jgi:hypothetical protein
MLLMAGMIPQEFSGKNMRFVRRVALLSPVPPRLVIIVRIEVDP